MKNNHHLTAIVYGWITILVLMIISSIILTIIIRFTKISEFTLSYLTLIIGLLILFAGGVVAGLKGKENGWILGSLTGMGFALLIFFIQYLGFNDLFSIQQFIYHITYILAAVVGSIVGVNLIVSNKKAS